MPKGINKKTEETRRKMSEAKKGDNHPFYGKHLSEGHKSKISEAQSGKKNHHWRGGKVKINCAICGKEKYFKPSHIKRGGGKFCSQRCYGVWNIKHMNKKDTDIERLMEAELIKQNIPYLKQAPIEGIALVDFLLPDKIIVQCDGDYFHNLPGRKNKDTNQDFVLGFKGYKVYRFFGADIKKSASKCIDKITGLGQGGM